MKVYIAGPMSGLPELNYPAFDAAEGRLAVAGHYVLNPTRSEEHNTTGAPMPWDWYMRHSLRMVADADGIALLPGWESSKGAQLEHHVASKLGLDIRPLEGWTIT